MSRSARRALQAAASLLLGLGMALLAGEGLLRLTGHAPFRSLPRRPNEPVLFEPDPVLGWRSRPGRLEVPGFVPGSGSIRLTNLPDGARSTGDGPPPPAPSLALLGGSFVQGWGVSDDETFAWALQRRWPGLRVANHGTGGYGTVQVLLQLERLLDGPDPPAAVLYGFVFLHEDRNVASADWLYSLALTASRGNGATPWASLSPRGTLEIHPPARYPRWPLDRTLASVRFAEDLAVRAAARERTRRKRDITFRLIGRLAALARRHGVPFGVVLLWMDPSAKRDYVAFLRRRHVTSLDCVFPLPLERRVPGDGHPDASQHALWADCVGRGVDALREAGWFSAAPATGAPGSAASGRRPRTAATGTAPRPDPTRPPPSRGRR